MKIYKQNGDILELTVSEYKELFETESYTIKYPDIPGEGYMSTSTK